MSTNPQLPRHVARIAAVLNQDTGLLRAAEKTAVSPAPGNRTSASEDGAALVRDLENFLTSYVILPERTALPLALLGARDVHL
jgi:hypothetical protein